MPIYKIKVKFCGKSFIINGLLAENKDHARSKVADLIQFKEIESKADTSTMSHLIEKMMLIMGTLNKKV